MFDDALGVAAAFWGVLMAVSPGLQIRKMLHHGSSREVSIAYFWVLLVGFTLWVAYGLCDRELVPRRAERRRLRGLLDDDRDRAALPAQGAGK